MRTTEGCVTKTIVAVLLHAVVAAVLEVGMAVQRRADVAAILYAGVADASEAGMAECEWRGSAITGRWAKLGAYMKASR